MASTVVPNNTQCTISRLHISQRISCLGCPLLKTHNSFSRLYQKVILRFEYLTEHFLDIRSVINELWGCAPQKIWCSVLILTECKMWIIKAVTLPLSFLKSEQDRKWPFLNIKIQQHFLLYAFKKDLGVPEVKHFEILGFKNLGKKVSWKTWKNSLHASSNNLVPNPTSQVINQSCARNSKWIEKRSSRCYYYTKIRDKEKTPCSSSKFCHLE